MNTVVTSREKLLAACRSIAATHGLTALNMRAVAAAANVAVGSVYNYFPSKGDLILATVEDIWRDIFHSAGNCATYTRFDDCIRSLFVSIQSGAAAYPDFLQTHMTIFDANDLPKARPKMQAAFSHMEKSLVQVLLQDTAVEPSVFDSTFTPQAFVSFVMQHILSLLCQPTPDITILLEIVRRVLYKC